METTPRSDVRLPVEPDLQKSGEVPLVPPQIIFFMGPEESGKSEQSKLLAKRTTLPRFSAGDIFRTLQESTDTTDLVLEAKALKKRGGYADANLFKAAMENYLSTTDYRNGVIIDGAPRTLDQVDVMATLAQQYIGDLPMHLVFVNMPRSRAHLRQAGRPPRPDDDELDIRLDNHYKDLADKVTGVLGYGGKLVITSSVVRDKTTGEVVGDKSIAEVNEEIVEKLGFDKTQIRGIREARLNNGIRAVAELEINEIAHDIKTLPKAERPDALLAYMISLNEEYGYSDDRHDAKLASIRQYINRLYAEATRADAITKEIEGLNLEKIKNKIASLPSKKRSEAILEYIQRVDNIFTNGVFGDDALFELATLRSDLKLAHDSQIKK